MMKRQVLEEKTKTTGTESRSVDKREKKKREKVLETAGKDGQKDERPGSEVRKAKTVGK